SSVPCRTSWLSVLSARRMGEVRFGPTTDLLGRSIRMNAGAPISSGRPFAQSSPAAQSNACTGAQMRTREPSKSPASAEAVAKQTTPIATRIPSRRMTASLSLDRIAATFQARGERAVVGVDGLLLLGLSLLLLLCLLLARATAASHGTDHGSDPRSGPRVAGNCADDGPPGSASSSSA